MDHRFMAEATMSMSTCSRSKQKKDGEHSSSSSGSEQQTAAAPGMRKGPWTEEEDAQLVWFVRLFGERRWDFLAKVSGLRRTGKSCRLRWVNYLNPGLRRGRITADEERLIVELHAQYGSRWSRIARSLPGRTDNEIKNFWRTRTRKHKAAAHQAKAAPASASSSSTVTTTTTASCSAGSPSTGCGTAASSSALRESGCGDDDDAEIDEASTTAASHQHHQQHQQQQQQDTVVTMEQFWNEIAAAASYMVDGCWEGAGHPAAEAPMPSSPVWEDCSDYSLWRIDDEEYYKKMLHAA